MRYLIDSANLKEIEEAVSMGVYGITANPSMYRQNGQPFYPFLQACLKWELPFLSGEVMGPSVDKMLDEAERILAINPNIVIKIGFSREGLKVCRILTKKGISCAMTLIFTVGQAVAAIGAGAAWLFVFVGRTDEYGGNGLELVASIQRMVLTGKYPVRIVAASIKNLHQLESLAAAGTDCAAIPYALFEKSLCHPLTESGMSAFESDWKYVRL